MNRSLALALGLLPLTLAPAVSAAPVVITFDELRKGTIVTNQYPDATFSREPGWHDRVTGPYPTSYRNGIKPDPNGPFVTPPALAVEFLRPVKNLAFDVVDIHGRGIIAQIEVHENGVLTSTVPIEGHATGFQPETQDLTRFRNVTRIRVHSPDGVYFVFDNFRFATGPPQPTSGISGKVEFEWRNADGQVVTDPLEGLSVELLKQGGTAPLASARTDAQGNYELAMPADRSGRFRLRVKAQTDLIEVYDAQDTHEYRGSLFSLPPSSAANQTVSQDLRIPLQYSRSGPFNILHVLTRANRILVEQLGITPPEIGVLWSKQDGRRRQMRVTDVFQLGGRQHQDEYDHLVILAMYGKELLATFSRDDVPPDPAYDVAIAPSNRLDLDPRVAWREGWGMFFAMAVISELDQVESSVYWDTHRGQAILVELETNLLDNSAAQTPNSHHVASIFWDLYDTNGGGADTSDLTLAQIWQVMTTLRVNPPSRFMNVMEFLELALREDLITPAVFHQFLTARDAEPIRDRIPIPIGLGGSASGFAISGGGTAVGYHARQFYRFQTEQFGNVVIDLAITGAAPGGPTAPNRMNLDLYLLVPEPENPQGSPVRMSLQPRDLDEQILLEGMPPGRWVVMVDSVQGGSGLNGAQFTLSVTPL